MELAINERSPLHPHAEILHSLLASWIDLSATDKSASFILAALSLRTNGKWAVGKVGVNNTINTTSQPKDTSLSISQVPNLLTYLKMTKNILKWCSADSVEDLTLRNIFTNIRLRGCKPPTNRGICGWYNGTRPLVLLHHIPSPNEVLEQQAFGRRVVTLFLKQNELEKNHVSPLAYMDGNHSHARDALDFLIHDLSHIELFCDATTYVEQVGFFSAMRSLDPTGKGKPWHFFKRFADIKTLWPQFQYVFSDMNCWSTHLLAYLKAKWLMHDETRLARLSKESKETEETKETKETKDTKETKLNKPGFQQGWLLMVTALGMKGDALQAANELCGGTKMTMKGGEALRDFFRSIGEKVLAFNNSTTATTFTTNTTTTQTNTTSNITDSKISNSSNGASLTITERVRLQVEEIRRKRTNEVTLVAKEERAKKEENQRQDSLFLQDQKLIYDSIVRKYTLSNSFKASHADRKDRTRDINSDSLGYGEVPFMTLALSLWKIHRDYGGILKDSIFYDLGSGAGKSVVAGAIGFPYFKQVIGIELLNELYEVSVDVLKTYHATMGTMTTTTMTTIPEVSTICGDLTQIPWWKNGNVIFCNSLVFDDHLLSQLALLLENVASGTFLISSGRLNQKNRLDKCFDFLECSVADYSWGKSSVWIHKRK